MKDDHKELLNHIKFMQPVNKLRQQYLAAKNSFVRRQIMAEAYKILLPKIIERAENSLTLWVYPYFLEWDRFSTPIEAEAWQCIRGRRVVFYPEFPVLNYFIDFANPYLKVGVELDGKEFHNAEYDRQRDKQLYDEGWTIYRIPGRECVKPVKDNYHWHDQDVTDEEFEQGISDWILETCDGVFEALYWRYFADSRDGVPPYPELYSETLDRHRSRIDPIRGYSPPEETQKPQKGMNY